MRGAEGRQTRRRQKGAAAKQMVTGFKRSSSQSDEGRTKLRSGGPRQAAKGAPNGPTNGLMGVNGKRGTKQQGKRSERIRQALQRDQRLDGGYQNEEEEECVGDEQSAKGSLP